MQILRLHSEFLFFHWLLSLRLLLLPLVKHLPLWQRSAEGNESRKVTTVYAETGIM